MKVSLVQMNSVSDKAKNIADAKRLMEQAIADDHADWLLLPEHFDWAGGRTADKVAVADQVPGGPAYEMCKAIARDNKVWVHAGSLLEKIPGANKICNTTVVFNRDGREVARYRKIHLFDITGPDGTEYNESATMRPGNEIVTYDCEGVTVGCAICYDLRFPELFQELARRGSKIIALPASFTLQTGKDHWEVLCRARAIETETYFLAAGQWGTFKGGDGSTRATYGHSIIVDPWGHVVAKASDGVGIVSSRLDMARVERMRKQIPVAEHKVLGADGTFKPRAAQAAE